MKISKWVCVASACMAVTTHAAPGEGIRVGGDVLVRPYVNAEVSYDSNPLILPKSAERDDTFYDVNPGVNASKTGENMAVEGYLWGRFRRFDKYGEEMDRDDWSQQLRLRLGSREGWNLRLHERFGRVSDYDVAYSSGIGSDGAEAPPLAAVERTSRVNRDLLDVGAALGGPLGDRTALNIRYDYGKTDYDAAGLLDSEEHKAAVKAAQKITDKSSVVAIVEYILMENDSLRDAADYLAARAGWRWQGTDKSRFEGSVGFYQFSMTDNQNLETESDGLSYDVAWYWQALSKVALMAVARSEMQLSAEEPASAKSVDSATVFAQYAATEQLSFSLVLGYRNEDYAASDRSAEQYHARVRCNYKVQKWLDVFGEVMHDETRSRQGDSEQVRVTLGAKAMY